jgi:arginine decarboxylase
LLITITTGIGTGPTPLAAFDAALRDAGIANYNLICLSSVIPTAGTIHRAKYVTPIEEYGHRLYLVMARHDADQVGQVACAGLGWTQERSSGRGLFVEIDGGDRREVEQNIQRTLGAMVAGRSLEYGEIESALVQVECQGEPVCALALAVYQSEGWIQKPGRGRGARKKRTTSQAHNTLVRETSAAPTTRITLVQD